MTINKTITEKNIKADFEVFLEKNKHRFRTQENIELVRKAFTFSYHAHKNMVHYSGKPYIYHPLEVAKIVSEQIGLGTTSVVCALLHDIPNKTEYETEDIKHFFGEKIYSIVSSLKKIKNTEYFKNNAQASILREILLYVSDDIRVIFIKIADKLQNIREIQYHENSKKKNKLIEDVLNIYAPLAHRLGLYDLKTEMEDLCLKNSNPTIFNQISSKLKSSEEERNQFIERFIQSIKYLLDKENYNYEITGRSKSIFSIWKKMQKKNVPIDEIYDLFAIRIIFKPKNKNSEIEDATQIGNIITNLYEEKKDRHRNWLKTSKDTGYRALHVTVMSYEGKWVEVQIRSEAMHEAAEHGLAAHWKYKGLKDKKTELDEKVHDLLNYLSEDDSSAIAFIENLKLNLFTTEISIFTPQGEVITLPKDATVLDFAFKIHTDIGFKSIAGKVNGKACGLDYKLKNGDQVEVITTRKDNIQKEWLDFVITQRAISKIKNHFRKDIQANINKGKNNIEKILKEKNQRNIGKCIESICKYLNFRDKNDFFEQLGENKIPKNSLNLAIKKFCINEKRTKFWDIKIPFYSKTKTSSDNISNLYKTATCCNPTPGNDIIGIKKENNEEIFIHDKNCLTAKTELRLGAKSITVNWTSYKAISILKKIKIIGTDEPGILQKIIKIISEDLHIKLKSLNFNINNSNLFTVNIEVYINADENSFNIINKLNKIKAINEVILLN